MLIAHIAIRIRGVITIIGGNPIAIRDNALINRNAPTDPSMTVAIIAKMNATSTSVEAVLALMFNE